MGGLGFITEQQQEQHEHAVAYAQTAAWVAATCVVHPTVRTRPLALDLKPAARQQQPAAEEDTAVADYEMRRAKKTAEFSSAEGLVGRLSALLREVKELSVGGEEGMALLSAKMAEVEERLEQMRRLVLSVAAAWLSPEVSRQNLKFVMSMQRVHSRAAI